MHVCVHMRVHVCVCAHVFMHVCVHMRVHACVCAHVFMHVCVHVFMHVYGICCRYMYAITIKCTHMPLPYYVICPLMM